MPVYVLPEHLHPEHRKSPPRVSTSTYSVQAQQRELRSEQLFIKMFTVAWKTASHDRRANPTHTSNHVNSFNGRQSVRESP
ncbi:hypothetical protein SRHO_G00201550 [Serrasalmus rhombeus]